MRKAKLNCHVIQNCGYFNENHFKIIDFFFVLDSPRNPTGPSGRQTVAR